MSATATGNDFPDESGEQHRRLTRFLVTLSMGAACCSWVPGVPRWKRRSVHASATAATRGRVPHGGRPGHLRHDPELRPGEPARLRSPLRQPLSHGHRLSRGVPLLCRRQDRPPACHRRLQRDRQPSPTGDGPTIRLIARWNIWSVWPIPGGGDDDAVAIERGLSLRAIGPGLGSDFHISGQFDPFGNHTACSPRSRRVDGCALRGPGRLTFQEGCSPGVRCDG